MDVGIVYAVFSSTGLPSRIGAIGSFILPEVGEVTIATLVDLRKAETILHAKVDRLTTTAIYGLLKSIHVPLPKINIPEFGFKNVEIYVAPNGGRIASVQYERGFTFMADVYIFNSLFARIRMLASPSYGFSAYGKSKAFKVGPLQVSDCILDTKVTMSEQYFKLKGFISIKVVFELLRRSIEVEVTKDRFYFMLSSTWYDLEASCTPSRPQDLTVRGTFKMDFINNLGKLMAKGINAIGKQFEKLNKGLAKLRAARDKVMKKLKSIKIPKSCGKQQQDNQGGASTLFLKRAFKRAGRAFRSAGRSINKVASSAKKVTKTVKQVTKGLKKVKNSFKKVSGMGKKFGAKFAKFGKKLKAKFKGFGKSVKKFGKKAGSKIKEQSKKAGQKIKKTAKKVGRAIKKAALKVCNATLKTVNKTVEKVKKAAKAVQKIKEKVSKFTKKYVVALLKGELFSLKNIIFEAKLANIMREGALRITVNVSIRGSIDGRLGRDLRGTRRTDPPHHVRGS